MLHLYWPKPDKAQRGPEPPPAPADPLDDSQPARHIDGSEGGLVSHVEANSFGIACCWLFPWRSAGVHTERPYPGRTKGLRRLFSGAITARAVQYWVTGQRSPPVWAMARVANEMHDRCVDGLEIERYLRLEIERRKREGPRVGRGIGRAMLARGRGEAGRLLGGPGE